MRYQLHERASSSPTSVIRFPKPIRLLMTSLAATTRTGFIRLSRIERAIKIEEEYHIQKPLQNVFLLGREYNIVPLREV